MQLGLIPPPSLVVWYHEETDVDIILAGLCYQPRYLDFYRSLPKTKYRILNSNELLGMKHIYSLAEMLEVDEIMLPHKTADCPSTMKMVHRCIRRGLSKEYLYQVVLEGNENPDVWGEVINDPTLHRRIRSFGLPKNNRYRKWFGGEGDYYKFDLLGTTTKEELLTINQRGMRYLHTSRPLWMANLDLSIQDEWPKHRPSDYMSSHRVSLADYDNIKELKEMTNEPNDIHQR